jgi:hypothetical protein
MVRAVCHTRPLTPGSGKAVYRFPVSPAANRNPSINFPDADFWKVSGIPLVRLKLHREVTATVKLAVQEQE